MGRCLWEQQELGRSPSDSARSRLSNWRNWRNWLVRVKQQRHVVTVSTRTIERKLVELARRVAALEAKTSPRQMAKNSWREAVGAMKNADLFEEALRLGAEWRARANVNGR